MMKKSVLTGAVALAAVFTALPALAQNVCLQLNRIKSTQVIDNQTIRATDWTGREYTIHMVNRCVSLDRFAQSLSFRGTAGIGDEYACIRHGDIVGYSLPGDPSMGPRSITIHGAQSQLQCTIDAVTAGAPRPAPIVAGDRAGPTP
jgi:hypothetical protein